MNKVVNHVRGMAPTRRSIINLALLLGLAGWVSVGVLTAIVMLNDGYILGYVFAFIAAFLPTQYPHIRRNAYLRGRREAYRQP